MRGGNPICKIIRKFMKTKTLFLILFVSIIAATCGWWAAQHFSHQHEPDSGAQTGGRKIRFYQCAMHPQVKSEKPGKCPICGMELSPIFEGQGALSENLITLDSNSISVIHVQTEAVKRQPLRRTLRVAGTIDDDDTKHRIISAYIDGRIEKLFVNYMGAEVEKGQPLAGFYSPNLLTAEREYLVLAQREPANGAAILPGEHLHMLEAAAQRLKRLGLTDAQIMELKKSGNAATQTQIVSPMSGTVVNRFVYEGQYVKEGDKLFEVADFSTMWFRFDAYESDLPFLKIGEKIEITTPSVPNKTYEAKIRFIDPNLNDPTRSAKIRVEIANPLVEQEGKQRRELLHRLYAEGVVNLSFAESLVVPRSAVLNPGGEALVYVEKSVGSYEPRKIELGSFGDEGWQVLKGLDEGERVVTSGNMLIDAQAQFNQGGLPAEHQHGASSANPSEQPRGDAKKQSLPLNESLKQSAIEFLDVADKISQALAGDNLKDFNEHAAKLHSILPALSKAFANDFERKKLIGQVEHAGHLPEADDLAAARKLFVPFSSATVEFAKTLQNDSSFKLVKIYRCPMADQAVPGSPKNGFWVQTNGPLRNPFFGPAMLTCGSEVKP